MSIVESFGNVLNIPDLKKRILFTLALLAVYRIGSFIPTPGINTQALAKFMANSKGTLLGMYDMFSGGNFARLTIFTLGIMPYISASIIMQLLTVVWPYLENLQKKEGEAGRKKITQYTRYGTIVLAVIQGLGISIGLEKMSGGEFIISPGWGFRLTTVITFTAGTAFIMWLGEQVTERGIGNGISLIIFAGIVARMPSAIINSFEQLRTGVMQPLTILIVLFVAVFLIAAVIVMQQAQRRVTVQYAKRVVGRRVYGGKKVHLPLKINTAGVIPVIFAQAVIMLPMTIAKLINKDSSIFPYAQKFVDNFTPGQPAYSLLYVGAIVFFCYIYTSIIFNPVDIADNIKKHGGFVKGYRPGKETAKMLDRILTRITFAGAIFLAVIALMPTYMMKWLNLSFALGGTALLIVVGVALDTLQQLESHLLMRHYEGFSSLGPIKGRR